jgi:hypothetical protein
MAEPNADTSLRAQIACLKREIALRKNCYPRWVQQKRMNAEAANQELAAMTAALHTLLKVQEREQQDVAMAGAVGEAVRAKATGLG